MLRGVLCEYLHKAICIISKGAASMTLPDLLNQCVTISVTHGVCVSGGVEISSVSTLSRLDFCVQFS